MPIAATAARPPRRSWLADTFRELHIDAHFARVPNPYADFDAGRAASIIAEAGFQMVSLFAVCNRGYSYYPTRIGTVHPGLRRDFTGEFTRALKKHGIRVLAYVSVRECPVAPWLEQTHLPQLKEILSLYDVDGFFFDAVLGKFVSSPTCGGPQDAAKYIDTVRAALKPGLAFVMNHLWVTLNPSNPPRSLKQLVWEPVPPYRGVITDDFSLEARYLSAVPGVENWSCMSTRGNGWGVRGIRDPNAYLREAAVVLAAGGRPYWGDVSHPSGNPDPELYRVWGEVNARTAALEPYISNVQPASEVALRIPSSGLAFARQALLDEHCQFSILGPEMFAATLGRYKVAIIPEPESLTAVERDALAKFRGAVIVASDPKQPGPLRERLAVALPAAKRQVEVGNAPASVEVTLNRRRTEFFIHLVNRSEDLASVEGIQIRVKTSARPKGLFLVPEKEPVRFEFREGSILFHARPLRIHHAYQIQG